MAARPFTLEDQKQLRTLHQAGTSRNQIAKQLNRRPSVISEWAKKMGLEFDGTLPANMISARAVNVKQRQVEARERKLLIDELMDARVLKVLNGDGVWVTRVKTQGGGERFEETDFIPSDDYRNHTSSSASLASAFKSYAPLETNDNVAAAESVVDNLIQGFQAIAKTATKQARVGDET
jgi:hypothetical protein